ncbi:MAG: hypothetical protein HZA94_02755 [Candidatus Vogelbacteria bacterium]|nr:hypothetical protein [Candidatus Vogelbacteria bacterium]
MPTITNTSQTFIPIKEIKDGVVVLKDGSMQMVLIASSLNFALKSKDEQQAIIIQYQNFLNSLDFSVQILVQSRRLDIRPYLGTLDDRIAAQSEELLRIQTKEYKEFVKKFTENVSIMSKTFFVIVPYNAPIIPAGKSAASGLFSLFGKKPEVGSSEELASFEDNRTQLEQRASVVTQGLGRLGVRTIPLGTEELIELFFKIFNPEETGGIAR